MRKVKEPVFPLDIEMPPFQIPPSETGLVVVRKIEPLWFPFCVSTSKNSQIVAPPLVLIFYITSCYASPDFRRINFDLWSGLPRRTN